MTQDMSRSKEWCKLELKSGGFRRQVNDANGRSEQSKNTCATPEMDGMANFGSFKHSDQANVERRRLPHRLRPYSALRSRQ